MAEPEELGAVAGEYVLGTLPADERRDFLRRMAREPLAVEAVRDWQERLAPLALAVPPVEPPVGLWPRIERTIDSAPVAANDNRVAGWRYATLAASLVALIAAGLALRPQPKPVVAPVAVQPVAFSGGVAALSSAGTTPTLIVTHDRQTGRLKIVPVNMPNDTLHSFELWAIRGKAAPAPLGLVDPRKSAQSGPQLAPGEDVTLAVSQEPIGGSPTGQPTGPVLWTGKLVTVPST